MADGANRIGPFRGAGGSGLGPVRRDAPPSSPTTAARPAKQPYNGGINLPRATGGGSGSNNVMNYQPGAGRMPMRMLQLKASANVEAPPVPVGSGESQAPQEVAMLPPPSIFDFGQRVAANPDLGKRDPAMEGLLQSFRRRSIY